MLVVYYRKSGKIFTYPINGRFAGLLLQYPPMNDEIVWVVPGTPGYER